MTTEIAETTSEVMGARLKRVEDPRLITGAAKYIDDLTLPGMAYVAILRSPHAHARINGIDTSRAAAHPGVVGVYTGKDFEELPALPCAWQAAGVDNFVATPRVLEIDRVTFTGAGVAAVVTETRAAAEDALRLGSRLSARLPGRLSCDEKIDESVDYRQSVFTSDSRNFTGTYNQ